MINDDLVKFQNSKDLNEIIKQNKQNPYLSANRVSINVTEGTYIIIYNACVMYLGKVITSLSCVLYKCYTTATEYVIECRGDTCRSRSSADRLRMLQFPHLLSRFRKSCRRNME